ncbi:hypothetical protein HGRIS_012674 [Hohenbuehelia grisea]|uniref:F-box domain-containing protein n=1 Tax=Hohenbuehelia grisea TaxID=104357 RepID=A0ABR3IT99_9AGAR
MDGTPLCATVSDPAIASVDSKLDDLCREIADKYAEICALERQKRELLSQRNALLPIFQQDVAIHFQICQFLQEPGELSPSVRAISQTCRAWREMVLEMPLLWTFIQLGAGYRKLAWGREVLKRSKGCPLYLNYIKKAPSTLPSYEVRIDTHQFFTDCIRDPGRIKSLSVHVQSLYHQEPDECTQILECIGTSPACLESLWVHIDHHSGSNRLPEVLLRCAPPRLRSLSLKNYQAVWTSSLMCASLTQLEIISPTVKLSLNRVVESLRQLPLLEALHLTDCITPDVHHFNVLETQRQAFALPRLRKFKTESPSPFIAYMYLAIRYPPTTQVDLKITTRFHIESTAQIYWAFAAILSGFTPLELQLGLKITERHFLTEISLVDNVMGTKLCSLKVASSLPQDAIAIIWSGLPKSRIVSITSDIESTTAAWWMGLLNLDRVHSITVSFSIAPFLTSSAPTSFTAEEDGEPSSPPPFPVLANLHLESVKLHKCDQSGSRIISMLLGWLEGRVLCGLALEKLTLRRCDPFLGDLDSLGDLIGEVVDE